MGPGGQEPQARSRVDRLRRVGKRFRLAGRNF